MIATDYSNTWDDSGGILEMVERESKQDLYQNFTRERELARVGKVQLIDASRCFTPRWKSIGTKRNDIGDEDRRLIVRAYKTFTNGIFGDKNGVYCESKIFETIVTGKKEVVGGGNGVFWQAVMEAARPELRVMTWGKTSSLAITACH